MVPALFKRPTPGADDRNKNNGELKALTQPNHTGFDFMAWPFGAIDGKRDGTRVGFCVVFERDEGTYAAV